MLIYICEELENDALQLKHLLSTFFQEKGVNLEVTSFSSGEELAANCMQSKQQPDLLFLDIHIGSKNGIQTAKELQNIGYQGGVILTLSPGEIFTGTDELKPLHCLWKPFDDTHFTDIMEQYCNIPQKTRQYFSFTRKKKEISIPFADILFFETGQPHTVILHTVSENVIFRGALSEVAGYFQNIDNFLPVGRSFVINLNHVTGRLRNDLIMSDGSIVQIPLRKQEDVLQVVKHWKKEETPTNMQKSSS